jgi:hypothetical protein
VARDPRAMNPSERYIVQPKTVMVKYVLRSNKLPILSNTILNSPVCYRALKRQGISDRAAAAILVLYVVSLVAFFITIRATTRPECNGFCSTAQVSVTSNSCTQSGQNMVCMLTALNTGTSNVSVVGCTIVASGTANVGIVGGETSVYAGTESKVTCTAGGTGPPAGAAVTGSIDLSNGASVPFAGVWS